MSTPGARPDQGPGHDPRAAHGASDGPVRSDLLRERYGAPAPWRRHGLLAAVVALVVTAVGWLAWTILFHASPPVASELPSFDIVADDTARATVLVKVGDDVEASCRVVARAADHTTVGELAFTPVDGTNTVEVRTERRATSVELVGCTAPGQPRPR